uniref:RxLR effector candidate protein n=1 Tax=Hyaloperonospora arabidopsidis (strain Emoy2) TaxID=559515 RepID=M4BBJ1_HYAAE
MKVQLLLSWLLDSHLSCRTLQYVWIWPTRLGSRPLLGRANQQPVPSVQPYRRPLQAQGFDTVREDSEESTTCDAAGPCKSSCFILTPSFVVLQCVPEADDDVGTNG